MVVGVTPAHEQALHFADGLLQYVVYVEIVLGVAVTCLASTSRLAGTGKVTVKVMLQVL
jgi:hypothetical protein